jgi:hypothetical protein
MLTVEKHETIHRNVRYGIIILQLRVFAAITYARYGLADGTGKIDPVAFK